MAEHKVAREFDDRDRRPLVLWACMEIINGATPGAYRLSVTHKPNSSIDSATSKFNPQV